MAAGQVLTDTTIAIGEVKISAYRVEGKVHTTPGSIAVLRGDLRGVAGGNNMASVINTVPGITMQTGTFATNRIVIRGMGSRTPYNTNRIRAYLNDIPITSSEGISTPEEINLQDIGRIEVLKGPSSAFYGSGLGGSLNMYTPENDENEGSVSLQYGSFNTARAAASGTVVSGNTTLWGSLGHLVSDGYRQNSDYRRTSFLATSKTAMADWSIATTLMLINVRGGIPSSLGRTMFENEPGKAAPNWLDVKGYQAYTRALAAVTLKSDFTTRFSGEGSLFGRFTDDFERRPFNDLDDKSASTGMRYKLSWKSSFADAALGTEWIMEQYSWKFEDDGVLLNENSEIRRHLNVFSVVDLKPVETLNISVAGAINIVGYRLNDLFPANGDQSGTRNFPAIFSPRLGVNYAPGSRFAVYASAGHGFSLPSPEETLLPEGDVNPDIKPEQGMQYEAGFRLNILQRRIEMDASFYHIDLNNLLVTKRVTEDIFTGINAGKTRHQGIELLLRVRVMENEAFPGSLSSVLSYTRSFNRFIEFTDNDISYDGNELPGIPAHTTHLQLFWNITPIISFDTHLQYNGPQYLTDSNSLDYPGYFLADARIRVTVPVKNTSLEFTFGLSNITDERYASMLVVNAVGFGNSEPRYYYPGMPRNWFASIKLAF